MLLNDIVDLLEAVALVSAGELARAADGVLLLLSQIAMSLALKLCLVLLSVFALVEVAHAESLIAHGLVLTGRLGRQSEVRLRVVVGRRSCLLSEALQVLKEIFVRYLVRTQIHHAVHKECLLICLVLAVTTSSVLLIDLTRSLAEIIGPMGAGMHVVVDISG